MSSNKAKINIYLIEEEFTQSAISKIIESKGFIKQLLLTKTLQDYKLNLYYKKKKSLPPWKSFLSPITESNEEILKNQYAEGFILLLTSKTSDKTYAITGGIGYFAIQEYINSDYGIDVLSRIIRKEDKIIKSTKEKSVIGGILGTIKFYRSSFNLFESESFGKIYQELRTNLATNILINTFGFTDDEIKRGSFCIAKSSFNIAKAISIEHLIKIISGTEEILETESAISINNVKKIPKKRNTELIKKLEKELANQLYNRYVSNQNHPSFDLCHKNFEQYLTADKYIVIRSSSKKNIFQDYAFEDLRDADSFFEKLKLTPAPPQNSDTLFKLLNNLRILTKDGEDQWVTGGSFLSHILGDIELDGKKYFYIENIWYEINPDFIADLNSSCLSFISQNYIDSLSLMNWPSSEDEKDYNLSHLGLANTLVLDRVLNENIELCDILKWDAENLYLIHVKSGFGNTVRDLASQIFIASSRLKQDISAKKVFIEGIYDSLVSKSNGTSEDFKKIGAQSQSISKNDFKALFKKNPIFVLAVYDTATDSRDRSIRNIEEFKSSIAKFSISELVKDMRSIDVRFQITQIK